MIKIKYFWHIAIAFGTLLLLLLSYSLNDCKSRVCKPVTIYIHTTDTIYMEQAEGECYDGVFYLNPVAKID